VARTPGAPGADGDGAVNDWVVRLGIAWPVATVAIATAALAAVWLERRAGGGRGGGVVRAVVVVLLVLALTGVVLTRDRRGGGVILADRSGSVAAGAADAALAALDLPRPDVAVLDFGDAETTDLGAAIDRAVRALPQGGHVLVLSDGRATDGQGVLEAGRAAAAGVTISALELPGVRASGVVVAALSAPPVWRVGDVLPVTVVARSSTPLSATLALSLDGVRVATAQVAFDAVGQRRVQRMLLRPSSRGTLALEARVVGAPDAAAGVDRAATGVVAVPPPRVLVVGDPGAAAGVADPLIAGGMPVQVTEPLAVPPRLSALADWDVIVLADVSARSLGIDQMAALEAYVSDLGRGLLLTGGRQSFLAGGWQSTPLASLAPVDLEPPARDERDAVALVLMIDQSASMGTADSHSGITKLDLAREAAGLAAEVLHPGDTVGVVTYDDAARWLVRPATVGADRDLSDVEAALGGLTTGGGTRIRPALELGLLALAESDGVTRHGVLVSDGRDFSPDVARCDQVVMDARAAGVTLSAIAIGFDADRPLLERLARLGRGRFHQAEDPSDLPRLAVEESEIARSGAARSGEFRVTPGDASGHAVLVGVDLAALPPLKGFLATRARDGADVVLAAPSGEPLLSSWQYGLGRVVAWTADVGEAWAVGWGRSDAAGALWRRVVYYLAPAVGTAAPGVSVVETNATSRVTVDAVDATGDLVDLADVTLIVTGEHRIATFEVPQVAPGRYAVTVDLPAPGAYPARLRVATGDDGARESALVLTRAGPPEVLPGRTSVLADVVEAGGGDVVDATAAASMFPARAARRWEGWRWFLVAAALVWLVDVARQMGPWALAARWRRATGSRARRRGSARGDSRDHRKAQGGG
jgi:Ca-activated chloride channel homolog